MEFAFPQWTPPEQGRPVISEDAYLAWLSEQRAWLISEHLLEKLQTDIARCPVDAPFVL
jgi:hypothetical protein